MKVLITVASFIGFLICFTLCAFLVGVVAFKGAGYFIVMGFPIVVTACFAYSCYDVFSNPDLF